MRFHARQENQDGFLSAIAVVPPRPRALVCQRVSDTRLTCDCRGNVSAPCRNQVGVAEYNQQTLGPEDAAEVTPKARSAAVSDLVQMVARPQRAHPVLAVSGMGCGFCGSSRSRMALNAWI
jgi:hypothetical protein